MTQNIFHGKEKINFSGKIDNVGEIHIISKTTSYIVTRLEVPDCQSLIPMTVTCGDGLANSEQHNIKQYKSKKCDYVLNSSSN